MDPLSPDSGLDGGLNDGPNDGGSGLKRESGLAPAGSLMSIQIRRRMPPKNRLLGTAPSVPAPAPVAARQERPAPAQKLTAPAPSAAAIAPAQIPPAEPPVAAPPAAVPPPKAPPVTASPVAAPPVDAPPVAAAPVAQPPKAAPPKPPVSAPPVAKPPVTAAPVAVPPAPVPPTAVPPVAVPPVAATPAAVHRSDPGRRAPVAASPTVSAAPTALTSPGIARYARTGQGERPAVMKPAFETPSTGTPSTGLKPPTVPKLPAAAVPKRTNAPLPPAPTPVAAPSPTPSPTPARAQTPPPEPEPVRPEGIVSYWLRLRGNRRYPSTTDLDQPRIAADWPNSILMRCRSGSKVLEPEKIFGPSKTGAPALGGGGSQAAMELSPMMLEWLMTLAADAARDRRPMQDTESFPSLSRSIRYGAFALPFSNDQTDIDHVLCHVYRAP